MTFFSTSVSLKSTESSLRFERGDEGYLHPCVAVLVSESESNDEYLKIHEQKSAESQQVPLPVIIVCLLAFLAIAIRFRKRYVQEE
ncbi:hypothetical protein [Methanosarcina barkeri]|uniref:hypothetical protein n=1 Tax=Methanosarcina barkeri TaxID=2208 RepID=UPI000AFB999A|nr:hypothetical protein [Methanosarcina barkeri]